VIQAWYVAVVRGGSRYTVIGPASLHRRCHAR